MINSGTEDVTISAIGTQSAIFMVTADEEGNTFTFPFTIEPGESQVAYVWFTPEAVTTYDDHVTIASNIDDVVVTLSGSGSAGLADIVINEIMYNPSGDQGDDDFYEFLELYNNEDYDVDLSGWNFTAGIEFTFGDNVTLAAGGYLVLAKDPDSIEDYYSITGVYGPFDGNLGNSGELVQLADADGTVADYVEYADVAPWPTGPDGNGPSLELIDPADDNSLAESWQASSDLGGTPGAENSDGGQTIQVANLGELRQQEVGSNVYVVTGEIILTYQQDYRGQKYFQDETAAILIDDDPGIMATAYNLYDGITGLTGTMSEYGRNDRIPSLRRSGHRDIRRQRDRAGSRHAGTIQRRLRGIRRRIDHHPETPPSAIPAHSKTEPCMRYRTTVARRRTSAPRSTMSITSAPTSRSNPRISPVSPIHVQTETT